MSYEIGDRIVYPMHGAGIIEAIEEKEILGEKKSYYVIKMPLGDMKVMLPTSNCKEIGVRDVVNCEEADNVISSMDSICTEVNNNWNKRYRENMDKLRSGDIYEIANVVGTLMFRDKCKGLSTGERKMLTSAKNILISELVLAKNIDENEVEQMIEEHVQMM